MKSQKTNEKFKVTANKRLRVFTIETSVATVKTPPMSRDEFEDALYNTKDDWIAFLRREQCNVVK